MSGRNFSKVQGLTREVKMLFLEADIGATGAPTLVSAGSVGVASITRTAAGDYDVVLDDRYSRLLNIHVTLQEADDEELVFQVTSDDVNSATKGFSVACTAGGVATDPSDGSKLRMSIFVKNSGAI